MNRYLRALAGLVAAALAATAAVALVHVLDGSVGTYTVTAQFRATPGLYPHNSVDILGVQTGEIDIGDAEGGLRRGRVVRCRTTSCYRCPCMPCSSRGTR